MDVRCEKCKTEYELEDKRVTGKGVTVKCTQCGHLFRVKKKTITGIVPPPEAGLGGSGKPPEKPSGKDKKEAPPTPKRWLIRRTSGEIFQFKELTTLQQWIVEEKVDREDEISKSGRAWEKLGAIEELKSFFTVVDQARQARRVKAKELRESTRNEIMAKAEVEKKQRDEDLALAPTVPPQAAESAKKVEEAVEREIQQDSEPDDSGEDIPTAEIKKREDSEAYEMGSGVYSAADDGPFEMGDKMGRVASENGRTAAWEKEGLRVAKALEPTARISIEEKEALKSPGSGALKVAAVVVIGAVVGLVAVIGIWKWDKIVDLLAGDEDTSTDLYSRARSLLLEDTDESMREAEKIFGNLFEERKSADARAGQAEVEALRALYLGWEADALDRTADRMDEETARKIARVVEESGKEGKTDKAPVPPVGGISLNPEAAELRRKASETRALATIGANKALEIAREAYEARKGLATNRAMALALVAAKRPSVEVEKYLDAALEEKGNDPETLFVKGVLLFSQEKLLDAERILNQAVAIHGKQSTKMLFRAHYALAVVAVEMKDADRARTQIQNILAANKNHERAEQLLQRIQAAEVKVEEIETAEADPEVGKDKPGDEKASESGEEDVEKPKETEGEPAGPKPFVGDYDSLVRQGDRFSEIGRVDDAVRAYNQALEQRPSGVEALTGLAYCYLDRGNMSQARSVFQRALSRSPGHGEALIGMAEIFKKEMNWNRALEYYRRYLKHHPGGRRSGLAHRNIRELEDRVKREQPDDTTQPPDEDPDDGETGVDEPGTIVVPPPKEKKPDVEPKTVRPSEDDSPAEKPRPSGSKESESGESDEGASIQDQTESTGGTQEKS